MNILIVEDQIELRSLIVDQLRKAGIHADSAETGENALDMADPDVYDVIVLDRGLPDMEGLEVLEILRSEGVKTPVLILTAKDGLGDKVEGLNGGADDYLVKPFEMEELVARIHALHRRPVEAVDTVLKIGNLEFRPSGNVLQTPAASVDLTSKEREVMERLLRLPGRVVSKDTLLSSLYGHGDEGSENSIEVIMHRLRKKLEEVKADAEIKTLRGIGYLVRTKEEK